MLTLNKENNCKNLYVVHVIKNCKTIMLYKYSEVCYKYNPDILALLAGNL